MANTYKNTMNLPQTDFPMRGNLPQSEPKRLEKWESEHIYEKVLEKNKDGKPFVLHDGPPYANGPIHIGHAFNKVLKDFVNKSHAQRGYFTPYVPGWDCHGQPIEHMVEVTLGPDKMKATPQPELRRLCREWATKYVGIQREGFKRLGVNADWEHPYLTYIPNFEAGNVEIFKDLYLKGQVYRGRKPIHWCKKCHTALAEAEIEYSDETSPSVYVKFKLDAMPGIFEAAGATGDAYVLIWTTTPWTLPANAAVCLMPDADYVMVTADGSNMIFAKELVEQVAEIAGWESYDMVRGEDGEPVTLKGTELTGLTYTCPIRHDLKGKIIYGDHVTLDSGTGCVHTAPGHGQDDYLVGLQFDIPILMPVDDNGVLTADAGPFAGLDTDDANPVIIDWLREQGTLVAARKITHSYPHCWRCHKPIIFRATPQWFCSVDTFKDDACAAADKVIWHPGWGHDRMLSMIRERADWCISRQRRWGLPIPVFYCADCGKPVCTPETIEKVSRLFGEHGSNIWFDAEAKDLLPDGFTCPHCGGSTGFTKETDTLDGWFDSGSTHIASMLLDAPGVWPADVYLEGGDQYRGWFQSSLLTGVAVRGAAPYREVLTHGWTVDGEGRVMHKSLGNGIAPGDIIPKYGADIIRLWAASADYTQDMRCSDNIFKQLSDKYLKIRNTARYILGNLDGFDPAESVAFADMLPLDKWAVSRLQDLIERVRTAYDNYEFHTASYAIHNFCVVEMSNFYLDVIKDRLYCDSRESLSRRSAQTAIYQVLDAMTRLLAPVLCFTADEIWLAMPHTENEDARAVALNDMPEANDALRLSESEEAHWSKVMRVRADVNKALELARAEKLIGKPLDARVTLYVSEAAAEPFAELEKEDLAPLCIVSELKIVHGAGEGVRGENFDGLTVHVEPSALPRCARCWTRSKTVGTNEKHPTLCARCASVVG